MKFSDFLAPSHVVADMVPGTKEGVLRQMLAPLVAEGMIAEPEPVIGGLLEREQFMTTAIKRGIAIPHAYTSQLRQPQVILGRCQCGTDFHSLDGTPTYCFFLLLEPDGSHSTHLQVLSVLSQIMKDDQVLEQLRNARNAQQIIAILREREQLIESGGQP